MLETLRVPDSLVIHPDDVDLWDKDQVFHLSLNAPRGVITRISEADIQQGMRQVMEIRPR